MLSRLVRQLEVVNQRIGLNKIMVQEFRKRKVGGDGAIHRPERQRKAKENAIATLRYSAVSLSFVNTHAEIASFAREK